MVKKAIQLTEKKTTLERCNFPIIAIGGSAGSLKAFEVFFKRADANQDLAYVIILHVATERLPMVLKIFQKFCSIPVVEITNQMQIKPGHVYLMPSAHHVVLYKQKFQLHQFKDRQGVKNSIDIFFQSLAEECWDKAIGIIFSGIGIDGQAGVKAIKEKLGMIIVQQPETAPYKNMPEAALKTYMADYILHPADMPATITEHISNLLESETNAANGKGKHHQTVLQKILLLLRSYIGYDFTLYKKNTIIRRIERRIAFHKFADFSAYFEYISENTNEMHVLFKELLIGVTKFFRDTEAFENLKKQLYKNILKKEIDEPIRIWIAGCSTGEEAYSVGILILEFFDIHPSRSQQRVQIFATDLDETAIEFARHGLYPKRIEDELTPQRLARFFTERNKGYVVRKELRDLIVFAKHNLIKDAPFTRLDLLCCRNVLIYFSVVLQKKILPVFHYALANKGLMFLGPAETTGIFNDSFNILVQKWKIFEKRNAMGALPKMIDFPFNIATQQIKILKQPTITQNTLPMANTFEKILIKNYTPSSLLVNEKGDILYINGYMNPYLQINSGEAIMNVSKMVREELRYPVANAIHQAYIDKKSTDFVEVKLVDQNITRAVEFKVDFVDHGQLQNLLIVVFKDNGTIRKPKKKQGEGEIIDQSSAKEVEKELEFTKRQLNSTIEQMETSLEELKSTNEELQSTNEELQSTNEEALTTKEEMQSLNEELMTINLQYRNKTEELTRLNNDMKNLLDNTEIGTIFLDNDLNILRFTPQVTKLFNVLPQDVGRSITHIVSNFDYPSVETAILEVIERLAGKELEVKTKKDEWYNLRIMPYRTMDNFINGAVLTFTKITPLKSLENMLTTLHSYVQTIVDHIDDAAIILDQQQKVLVVNKKFLKLFHLKEEQIKDNFFMEVVLNNLKTNKLSMLLTESNSEEKNCYLEHHFPNVGLLKLMVTVDYVKQTDQNDYTGIIVKFKEQQEAPTNEKQ